MIYRFPCGGRLPREAELVGVPLAEPGDTICVWSNNLPKGQNATSPALDDGTVCPCLMGCDHKARRVKPCLPEDGGEGRRFVVLCRPVIEEGGAKC